MPILQINYDLNNQKDYRSLFQAIKDLGPWAHPLGSCWLVRTQKDAIAVRNHLLSVIDRDDSLLVTTVSVVDNVAWHNLPQDVSDWMRVYLTPAYA